jgi:phosphoribosylanthranilate isomerase
MTMITSKNAALLPDSAPHRILVKVCGMSEEANIEEVLGQQNQPDYLGFIFYPTSPRFVGNHTLSPDFMRSLASRVSTVGVFVNAPIDDIVQAVERFDFHAVQLHGAETPAFCTDLGIHLTKPIQSGFRVQVWKAFSIATKEDIEAIAAYNDVVDLALLDTKGAAHGGNGTRFDWSLLRYYSASVPFFLSGGIAPEHGEEIRQIYEQRLSNRLRGVDVNSRFEISPALKDAQKVHSFLDALWKSA